MPTNIGNYIDITNPEFKQKYTGRYFADYGPGGGTDPDTYYQFTGTEFKPVKTADLPGAQRVLSNGKYIYAVPSSVSSQIISWQGGNVGLQEGDGLMSNAFKYYNPTAYEEARKATSNFGMGTPIEQSKYTGETAGFTQGGVQLWKLNDGTVTSTPPSGKTSENQPVGPSGIMEAGPISTQPQQNAPINNTMTKEKWDEAVKNDPGFAQLFAQYNPYQQGSVSGSQTDLPGVYIENEADLQNRREELAKAGIPMNEWSKYVINEGGKLYFRQPATLTSPTGEKKIVPSGSDEASQLLDSSWTLGNKVGGGTIGGGAVEQIDTSVLKPEAPVNIGGGTADNTYNADTTAAGADATSKSTDELIKYYQSLLTAPESDLSKAVSKLLGETLTETTGLTGRGAMQTAEEQKRGIEEKNAALASANSQLKAKLAEIDALTASYNQANQAEEGVPTTLSRLQGKQAQNYKLYLAQKNGLAAEAGILQANILGLQGEITAAQNAANRAVDLAYADKESAYNAKIAQLNILQPQLEKEEQKYTNVIQMVLQQQADALAEQKANQKLLLSSTLDTMAKYPDAGITVSDTPETIQAKVAKSAIYREQVRPPQYATSGGTGSGSSGITGVVTGTTGTTPINLSKLPAAAKEELITFDTLKNLATQVLSTKKPNGSIPGTGAIIGGTVSQLLSKVGLSNDKVAINNQTLIGNIKATVAKMRGGTSFTANEEKLLNTYTPSINDSPAVLEGKLNSLMNFIDAKRANTLSVYGYALEQTQSNNDPLGIFSNNPLGL